MADFTKDSVADMAAANPGINMGTTGSLRETERASDELLAQEEERQQQEREPQQRSPAPRHTRETGDASLPPTPRTEPTRDDY